MGSHARDWSFIPLLALLEGSEGEPPLDKNILLDRDESHQLCETDFSASCLKMS